MLLIDKNIQKIKDLCKKHKVKKLYLFGSATSENFIENSDIDFLVSFNKSDLTLYFENYMALKDKLNWYYSMTSYPYLSVFCKSFFVGLSNCVIFVNGLALRIYNKKDNKSRWKKKYYNLLDKYIKKQENYFMWRKNEIAL